MTIAIILVAALVLGVVLMNEYGWADLTGSTRNNLVFETRNKSYGAFEIRQKYGIRLSLALFGTLGVLTLAAFTPKMFHTEKAAVRPTDKIVNEQIIDNNIAEEKPEEKIEEPQEPQKQDVSTVKQTPPLATDIKQPLDTAKIPDHAIASNVTHTGTDTTTEIDPRRPIGTGGNCIDCETTVEPPVIREVSEVTEQAEFDYKKYFQKNLRIPDQVLDLNLENGKVYVSFVLDEEGNVTNVAIKRGMVAALDNEIKRVTAAMPKWKPAKFNEKPVKVRMVVPISISFR